MSQQSLRNVVYVLGAVAVVSLLLMIVPQLADATAGFNTIITWVFWVSFIALLVALFSYRRAPGAEDVEVEGPGFARFLFNNSAAGLFWLPIRVFLGIEWLDAGLHKLLPAGKAVGAGWLDGGSALRGFWMNAVSLPDAPARPPITYDWYRDFLNLMLNNNAETWFAWLIVFGEIAVGLGLIFGILTGVAAFFGATMNMSFSLAGSASTNPVMFTMAIGLMLAWKVAGYYGVDRWLLPRLGTPWRPGTLFVDREARGPSTG
jgi:thiosulfate dehydrogenase [quinone] large subunit